MSQTPGLLSLGEPSDPPAGVTYPLVLRKPDSTAFPMVFGILAGFSAFVLLVFLLYLPLSFLIPSSSGLATLSVPIVAPLGRFAGVSGALVVTAFQSACGLVNLITPTAAVVMGALALGHVPYDCWVKFSWKLLAGFFALTLLLLAAGAAIG